MTTITLSPEDRRILREDGALDGTALGDLGLMFERGFQEAFHELMRRADQLGYLFDLIGWDDSHDDEPIEVAVDADRLLPWLKDRRQDTQTCIGDSVVRQAQQERGDPGCFYSGYTQEESLAMTRSQIVRDMEVVERLSDLIDRLGGKTAAVVI